MKTKLTATIAIAVVAMMVFSTVGATTFSWFTDTEETDITITTGKLAVDTGDFIVDAPTGNIHESDMIPENISIIYDDSRAEGNITRWVEATDTDNSNKLIIAGNPSDVGVRISYSVTFSGDVDYKYYVGVKCPEGMGVNILILDEMTKEEVKCNSWIYANSDPKGEFNLTLNVTLSINSIPEDLNDALIKLTNMITQYLNPADLWDGTVDTTWYDDSITEFTLDSVEQLAGLVELIDGGETFSGKTVKLDSDLDLYRIGSNGEPICFEPIGSYRYDTPFKGTFDGQGHTISNLYQNNPLLF